MKTNKISYSLLFTVAIIGFVSFINMVYTHTNTTTATTANMSKLATDKLLIAETQITLVTAENNALRNEIEELKTQITTLSSELALNKK